MVNVLCVLPPHIPSYFNAGHHLPVFMVGAFVRTLPEVGEVRCIDAAALNYTWRELAEIVARAELDVIAVMNDFDSVDDLARFVTICRTLAPRAKIITFGRLSKQIPGFFRRFDIDAIAHGGDYEACLEDYLAALAREQLGDVPGVSVRDGDGWRDPVAPGRWLEAERWVLPDVSEIPYRAYDSMYRRDENKFCGIPERRELVVPLARGCPVGCAYCDVPTMQGRKERRLSVDATIEYIVRSFEQQPFEYVSFYAPTFTLKRAWVEEFCARLGALSRRYPWKCVTTTHHLDERLIATMADSGCIRISVGLETLDPKVGKYLPVIKRDTDAEFERVADWCLEHGVELNCFVILGLPGETIEGARYTMERVKGKQGRVRPTIFTPYDRLSSDSSPEMVSAYSRMLVPPDILTEDERRRIHELYYAPDRATRVMDKIPQNEELQRGH